MSIEKELMDIRKILNEIYQAVTKKEYSDKPKNDKIKELHAAMRNS